MKTVILCCLLHTATADLRQAAQPKKAFNLLQQGGGRGAKNFVVGTGQTLDGQIDTANKGIVVYMEPSVFGYQGLVNQRAKNYDNFIRSNIDNEQDNRNFNNEAGLDHLPFRTYESAVETAYPYTGTKAGGDDDSLQVNNVDMKTVINVKPGEPRLTPLRWNNPHAAELEVNLWIMCADPPTVVPVKKPACSGEGNQNNIIEWAIPSDFNDMNWAACPATACFNGCVKEGDCVLQIYAHSVETRQYSTSVPIIIQKGPKVTDGLKFNPTPKDVAESNSFAWPKSYDLNSLTQGTKAQDPGSNTGGGGTTGNLANVKICASSEKEGVTSAGEAAAQVELKSTGVAAAVNSGTVHLYLCKQNQAEREAEQLVDKVTFTVTGQAQTKTKVENYTPFEMASTDEFGAAGLKTVTAELLSYGGQTRTINVQLDLSNNKRRWRFRRHLQAVCPTGLKEPASDPWMDLSKLKRETCMSSQDPNANYPTTQPQRAVLHSDVANHAYQNSNYSPYSGQQHGEISRTMQAAAVIHMTSANRGELGKNNIPNEVKQTAKQLNKAVNKLYQAYEKVANKVIDALTKADGTNTATLGVQPLGTSFRSAEKGATSTKRLKTTTYVPSFNTAGYDMNVIQNVLKANAGRNGVYADLLSAPKPNTGAQFIEIYTATMNKMLPAFAQAQAKGVTYMESVKMVPCSTLSPQLAAKSQDYNTKTTGWMSTACCTGSMQDTAVGKCGATMPDITTFKKRNANNRQDGGQYAAQQFQEQRYYALYQCPGACQVNTIKTASLVAATTKTSKGTCVTWLDGANGCVPTAANGALDCRPCAAIFNNVAPKSFSTDFGVGTPTAKLDDLVARTRTAEGEGSEDVGSNVLNSAGDALVTDDTAVCHTPSTFTCPGEDADFAAAVEAGGCKEEESTKIDNMCDDGPCDNDPDSETCKNAKLLCEVDPDSGVLCMPDSENDPCQGCVKREDEVSHGEIAAVSVVVLLASTLV